MAAKLSRLRGLAASALLGAPLVSGPGTPVASAAQAPVPFADIQRIIEVRCQSCHSDSPTQQDIYEAPDGIKLDDAEEIKAYAAQILQQVVILKLMPKANVTAITDAERAEIARWVAEGAPIS